MSTSRRTLEPTWSLLSQKKISQTDCVTANRILVHGGVGMVGVFMSLNHVLDYCHILDVSEQTENIKDETHRPFKAPGVNNSG